jgi:hypothetical protein
MDYVVGEKRTGRKMAADERGERRDKPAWNRE